MPLSTRRRRQVAMLLRFLLVGGLVGALYGMSVDASLGGGNRGISALRGFITGMMVTCAIASFEIFYVNDPAGQSLRRLPFMKAALLKTLFYSVSIILFDALGNIIVPIEGAYPIGFNLNTLITLAMALTFTFIISTLMQINQLLGPGVLINFIRGRYHQPRHEERLFLFIDMRGSTAIAERIGDINFHRLLNQFLSDIGEVMANHGGSIDKYVGDEMIATWHLTARPERAFEAVFEARALLAERAALYRARFDALPDFRAVLHAGPVVVGEMGDQKREIALLGDTINTTAKLEHWAKGATQPVVASRAALDAAGNLPGLTITSLGAQMLPGKTQAIDLFAVEDLSTKKT